jgi:hypothetical protein
MNRAAIVSVIFFSLFGCRRCAPTHPQIGIEIRNTNGFTVFSFGDCLGTVALPINKVAVYAGNDGPEGRPPICKLVVAGERYGQVVLDSWQYGSEPPGYKLLNCRPLEQNKRYDVHASGSGLGVRRFLVRQDGTAQPVMARCR